MRPEAARPRYITLAWFSGAYNRDLFTVVDIGPVPTPGDFGGLCSSIMVVVRKDQDRDC